MQIKATRQTSIARYAIVLLGSAALTGCVASAIDTPQNFVSSLEQPADTSDVLALADTESLPKPDARPASDVAETEEAQARETAQPEPTPKVEVAENSSEEANPQPAEAQATATAANTSDVANQRILAAENAPTANGEPTPPPQVVATAPASPTAAPRRQNTGLLSALFGNSNRKPPAPVGQTAAKAEEKSEASRPQRIVATARASGSAASLPGVDRNRALGVSNEASDSTNEPIQVASAAGLARLAPNGIETQHAGVDVKCFKPALVRVLKTVERKFGKPVVVTSGYRSPARNKRARGAKNSLHIYCAAADIQVAGVSKWTLAKYLRSMPGRGGVGTYCHTKSVHVDIGPKRDWNWRCRRKK